MLGGIGFTSLAAQVLRAISGVGVSFGSVSTSGNLSVGGNATVSGTATFGQLLGVTISPAQITSAQNNYDPPNLSTARIVRINSDARRNVTGLAGGVAGREVVLINSGNFPIPLTYEDTGSTAANRFAFGWTLGGGQSVVLVYDGTTARWRLKSCPSDPVGAIRDFSGTTVPEGYLALDGSNRSRTTYAPLFNEIGTTHGVGDGSTTFGTPDFRRRVSVGSGGSGSGTLGNATGNTGGGETHTLITAELAAHAHTETVYGAGAVGNSTFGIGADDSGTFVSLATDTAGSGNAHNNMQPSIVVTKIIKF